MHLTLRLLTSTMTTCSRTFLFWFSNEQSNFRFHELEALFKVFQLDQNVLKNKRINGPYVLLNFPDEEGPRKLMSRSVLAHSCYEIWGQGTTKVELDDDVKKNLDKATPFLDSSFQVKVDTYGKTITHKEKIDWINTLAYLPLEGKVDLKQPEMTLGLLLYYGLDSNNVPEVPHYWYFGRWIADGQRKLASKTNLKTRKFIGNTSMDPLLSLLMANLARVRSCDLVLDPFVGTGSILVGAAAMGAYVMGSDIDYLMLHGRTRSSRAFEEKRSDGENIRANMVQYGLESKYIDVLVSDASRPLWRDGFKFDAIITDPPYGIREPTERLGSSKDREPGFKIKEEHLRNHIPEKKEYSLTEIFCDLMNFAVNRLVVGGRLVYWMPISRTEYVEDKLPTNPGLELVANIEQVLTSCASRRLLVFEKTREISGSCLTEVDGTALMYRFRYFDTETEQKKERKSKTFATYGKATKRGQLLHSDEMRASS